ncbi:MarR family winged helix-turn-helix transcriptional regulator [Alkalibacter mobilis]|uniref:MarR family winged helix-turn-helix transcriptional regulator n=1 Tax=Alkalibacter mobilis TaxID=2787712 RepID=UPI00189E456A|nr:MarR family transcriptional regulator [Alkalibacter mobilis]MBF7096399.1 MarR family transcriptional regulator [Alkalibacter mobilis]
MSDDILSMKYQVYNEFSGVLRHHYKRLHELLEEINVYPGQPPLLFILEKEGGLSQKILAKKINIKPSTLTTMLKCMENNGIVKKVQDDEDKRVTRVFLTEYGRDTVMKTKKIMNVISEEALSGFDSDEVKQLGRLFTKMKINLGSTAK